MSKWLRRFGFFFSFEVSTTNVTRFSYARARTYATHETIVDVPGRSWTSEAKDKERESEEEKVHLSSEMTGECAHWFLISFQVNCARCSLIKYEGKKREGEKGRRSRRERKQLLIRISPYDIRLENLISLQSTDRRQESAVAHLETREQHDPTPDRSLLSTGGFEVEDAISFLQSTRHLFSSLKWFELWSSNRFFMR